MELQPSLRATTANLLKHPFGYNVMKGVPRMMKMATRPGDLIGC
ncbi:BnaAnng30980D [Brassica napus]|uniref:BnaAnng30980D protein n=2 Tax=Brassica TaxID=3705 RepID=A0A078JPV0_BRANA|nr:BnaAnng30980D [Brassica napus]VDC90583.1 unnamed protein product [Brassica rapa]